MTYQQPTASHYQSPHAPSPGKGLGIAAMVVGIVGIVFSFIPFVGFLSLILGPAAVVLGILAVANWRGRGQGWAGIVTGVLGTLVAAVGIIITFALMPDIDSVQQAERDLETIQDEYTEEVDQTELEEGAIEEGEANLDVDAATDVFDLGETVAIVESGTDEDLYTITMNAITPDFQCTYEHSQFIEADSGAFLGIDLSISAADEAAGPMTVVHQDFYLIDSNGEITDFGWPRSDAGMCIQGTDQVQEVRPGTNSTGMIAFDSPVESGTLIYEGGPSEIRWEF